MNINESLVNNCRKSNFLVGIDFLVLLFQSKLEAFPYLHCKLKVNVFTLYKTFTLSLQWK
jgi:hypothetical protein